MVGGELYVVTVSDGRPVSVGKADVVVVVGPAHLSMSGEIDMAVERELGERLARAAELAGPAGLVDDV